eukprot:COSAG06_NODE_35312_length_461_cov_1.715470_1_plen_58_part_10
MAAAEQQAAFTRSRSARTAFIAPGSAAATVRSTVAPDDGKRDLAQLRALDPMPVLGDA